MPAASAVVIGVLTAEVTMAFLLRLQSNLGGLGSFVRLSTLLRLLALSRLGGMTRLLFTNFSGFSKGLR